MRRRNLLRHPLNAIFASESHVRVLRALMVHGGQLSPPDLAARTGLTPQGTRNVLTVLVKTGVVVETGLGRYKHYEAAPAGPLMSALKSLYAAETKRYEAVLDAIRRAAIEVAHPPKAVWLYGSAAREEDRIDSDVDIAAVFGPEPIDAAVEAFREAVEAVTGRFSLRLSVVGLSDPDVTRLSAGDAWWIGLAHDARTLMGPDPAAYVRQVRRSVAGDHA